MTDFSPNNITGTLEEWTVVGSSPYQPPENSVQLLTGKIYKHATFDDGKRVSTSAIVSVNGNIIETKSGSFYKLGKPHNDYVAWCEDKGYHVPTPEEPIRVK